MGTDVTVVSGWGYIVYIELCQAMPGIQAGHCKTLYTAAIQLSSSVLISDFKIDTKCQLECNCDLLQELQKINIIF